MLQYVNGFSCSLNNAKNTLVIHFNQEEPIVVGEGENSELQTISHEISSIVMDSESARQLLEMITQLLESPDVEPPVPLSGE